VKSIFGRFFVYKLMSNMHLKLYNFVESEKQIRERKDFKTDFSHYYGEKLAMQLKELEKRELGLPDEI